MTDIQVDEYPLLPLRRGVLLPGSVSTLPVGRKRSLALVDAVSVGDKIVITSQLEAGIKDPSLADLHTVGVLARVHRIGRSKDGSARLVVETGARVNLIDLAHSDPYFRVRAQRAVTSNGDSIEAKVLAESLREHVRELAGDNGGNLAQALRDDLAPADLADALASSLPLERAAAVEILMTFDVVERLRAVVGLINATREHHELKKKIDDEVRKSLGKNQREAILRERMKAIQSELGEGGEEDELAKLRDKLASAELPDEVQEVVDRELKRLARLNVAHPEAGVVRSYLEVISELPWSERAEVKDDLDAVAAKLDADHHGLDEVKQRILEHMAVLKLSGGKKGTILCLAGPPGVGKTSLGRSIADATGRPFVRISLGGVRDEAEIRGHRRTYVGAIPGRIVNAIRKAGVKNPVMLLDEVDKLSSAWGRSPESALLELLDPEQNHTFTDHYLELPFDLSEVMFVVTANDLGKMSAPLRDRLEIVELSGYTPDEKLEIARTHLIPRQLADNAVGPDALALDDGALRELIMGYTREAGVRQLGRELGKIARAVALDVARHRGDEPFEAVQIERENLERFLGKRKFFSEVAERTAVPGVATGLAWTPVGGEILFIETSQMKGKGNLQITGQLGDVMKESARAAMSYVRSNAERFGVEVDFLEGKDVHIHIPAGAVPKDGPSAGVTMFTALTSLLSGRRVRSDTAMTGECTLRGRVLPVGGIKAKVLAAHRAGIERVILPRRNGRDIDEVPEEVRKSMQFILVDDMAEALEAALVSEDQGEVGVSDDEPDVMLGIGTKIDPQGPAPAMD